MRILSVASEAYPLIKTGGLADVVGALPLALEAEGMAVRTLVPGYPRVMLMLTDAIELKLPDAVAAQVGSRGRLLAAWINGLDVLVLDIPALYDRPGSPYLGPDGQDWPDNALRFAALARTAAEIGIGALPDWVPDIVHAHDWQAGLAPAYLHYHDGPRPGTLMTVHNLAFPGKVPLELLTDMQLPPEALGMEGVEFYGSLSMLKAGLQFADRITTVSPSYAAEIVTSDGGMGFDGLLRERGQALSGILNGIDTIDWNPATDTLLAERYTAATIAGRATNKATLQSRMGLAQDASALLFGVVSRLTWQKGLDMLLEALPALLDRGAQLAVLGAGDPVIEAGFREAAAAYPGRIGCIIGYDERLAHTMQAGADALLVPSRFEPCGLTQLYALRYGAIPVVARVGGLADTVIDANPMALSNGVATGVQFFPVTPETLSAAIAQTANLYADRPAWLRMQANGMATDVSWRGPAQRYAALYRSIRTPAV